MQKERSGFSFNSWTGLQVESLGFSREPQDSQYPACLEGQQLFHHFTAPYFTIQAYGEFLFHQCPARGVVTIRNDHFEVLNLFTRQGTDQSTIKPNLTAAVRQQVRIKIIPEAPESCTYDADVAFFYLNELPTGVVPIW